LLAADILAGRHVGVWLVEPHTSGVRVQLRAGARRRQL